MLLAAFDDRADNRATRRLMFITRYRQRGNSAKKALYPRRAMMWRCATDTEKPIIRQGFYVAEGWYTSFRELVPTISMVGPMGLEIPARPNLLEQKRSRGVIISAHCETLFTDLLSGPISVAANHPRRVRVSLEVGIDLCQWRAMSFRVSGGLGLLES